MRHGLTPRENLDDYRPHQRYATRNARFLSPKKFAQTTSRER